jgi:hypothetical protein
MSLYSRNLVGAAFSLIFLRFSAIKTVAAIGALTVALLGTIGVIRALQKLMSVGSAAARTMEDFGQQMVNFFRSLEEGRRLTKFASNVSRTFGIVREDAREMTFELAKIGQANDQTVEGILDTAAATGKSISDVTKRFTEITTATADQREDIVEKFAKDFNIEVKRYGSNIELLNALNERFGGSARQMADTSSGAIRRLNEMWLTFKETVGEVVNRFFRPMIDVAMAFVTGLQQGFTAARDAAIQTGDLTKEVNAFKSTMVRLMPIMLSIGRFLGSILVPIIRLTMRLIKGLAELFMFWWRVTKPIRDALRALGQIIKEHVIDKVVEAWNRFKDFAQFLDDEFGIPKEITISIGLLLFGVAVSSIGAFIARLGALTTISLLGSFIRLPIALAWLGKTLLLSPLMLSRAAMAFVVSAIAKMSAAAGAGAGGAAGFGIPVVGWIALAVALVVGTALILHKLGFLDEIANWITGKVKGFLKLSILFLFGEEGWENANELMDWLSNFIRTAVLPNLKIAWDFVVDNFPFSTVEGVGKYLIARVAAIPIIAAAKFVFSEKNGIFVWGKLQGMLGWIKETFKREGIVGLVALITPKVFGVVWDSIEAATRAIKDWFRNNVTFSAIMVVGLKLADGAIDRIINQIKNAIPGAGLIARGAGFVEEELFGGQFGGTVPGPRGHKRLVVAEAGERFLGAPTFANSRPGAMSGGGGSGTTVINVNVSNSVVTNNRSMDELSERVAASLIGKLGVSRRLTLHRVTG